jgi:hypothetical protein
MRAELAALLSGPAKADAKASTIEASSSPAPIADARRRELLALTPRGRQVLESQKA